MLADEDCTKSPTYYDYGEGYTQNIMDDMDCDENYYKCLADNSEFCRTVYSGECDYYLGYSCTYTTYFDDPIGEDKYWETYGSFYNATYWEYYDGETGETLYNNSTDVCDEDCEAEIRAVVEAVGTGAAAAGSLLLVWCLIAICTPICIICIVVCIVVKCIKDATKEEKYQEEKNAGETS